MFGRTEVFQYQMSPAHIAEARQALSTLYNLDAAESSHAG
jgi:hypothetical protein